MIIKMVLTNAFDPDPRVYKEAKALVDAGHDVEVLCWDRDNRYLDKPIDRFNEIKIRRFYPKSTYGSGHKQLISYGQYIKQVKIYLSNHRYDVIHAHDIDGAFASLFVKQDAKLIWDMHELYDGFNYGYLKSAIYEQVAKWCFKKTDGIIYVSSTQKERYKSKKQKGTKDILVMNAPEAEVFKDFNRVTSKKLRISFIGSVREYDTLKMLMDVGENYNNVSINLNGMGVAYKDLKKIEHRYLNTKITGKFKYGDIKRYYEDTDLIYAVYKSDAPNVKYAFPVKGLEAIITGTPIITMKNTYFGEFVEKYDIGYTIDDRNPNDLEELIKVLSNNKELLKEKMGNLLEIKNSFSWNEQREKLLNFYDNFIVK
jgi:glycosyltransferase involved in cell wall biosynthesis